MANKEQWPEGTVISTEGFFSPDGELLSGEPHTQAEVDEWNGTSPTPTVTEKSTKVEMEAAGRELGIELDRRKSKKSLWSQLKNII